MKIGGYKNSIESLVSFLMRLFNHREEGMIMYGTRPEHMKARY